MHCFRDRSNEQENSRFKGADVEAVREALLGSDETSIAPAELSEAVLDPDRLIFLREIFLPGFGPGSV